MTFRPPYIVRLRKQTVEQATRVARLARPCTVCGKMIGRGHEYLYVGRRVCLSHAGALPSGEHHALRRVGARADWQRHPKVRHIPETGCWVWTGYLSHLGYARTSRDGRSVFWHRLTWTAENGPVPEGMVLDHLCKNRACMNPDHLRVATHWQNVVENSVGPIALNGQMACCQKCGEPFGWVRVNGRKKGGQRRCLQCRRNAAARRERDSKTIATRAAYRAKNKDKARARSRAHYLKKKKAEGQDARD